MNNCNNCISDCNDKEIATIPFASHEMELYNEKHKTKRWKAACFALLGVVIVLTILLVLH